MSEQPVLNIPIPVDLKHTNKYPSYEAAHLGFLLMMRNAKKFLLGTREVLGNNCWDSAYEAFYRSIPAETLSTFGYSTNRQSFMDYNYIIDFQLVGNTLETAMTVEQNMLGSTPGLEFLKKKAWSGAESLFNKKEDDDAAEIASAVKPV